MAASKQSGRKQTGQTGSPKKGAAASRGRRTAQERKTGAAARTGKGQAEGFPLKKEALTLLFLAVCIFLLVGLFGAGGRAGDLLGGVLFGLFGLMAYPAPIALFVCFAVFMFSGRTGRIKASLAILLYICITAFLQLSLSGFDAGMGLTGYYIQSSQMHTGGGLVGAVICAILCPLVGTIGTYIALVAVCAVAIVFITEKSMLRPISESGQRAYEDAKVHMEHKRQERAVYREQKRTQRRLEQERAHTARLEGVSFETKLHWPDEPVAGGPEAMMPDPLAKRERKSAPSFGVTLQEPQTPPLQKEPAVSVTSSTMADKDSGQDQKNTLHISGLSAPAEPIVEAADPDGIPSAAPSDEDTVSRKKKTRLKEDSLDRLTREVEQEMSVRKEETAPSGSDAGQKSYTPPPLSLLVKGDGKGGDSRAHLQETAAKLEQTLANFGVNVHVTDASCGPSVTRYELQPEMGVKVSRIVSLADDIKLNLAVADLRIEAPIPGKAAVGIEIPNKENTPVMLRDLLESQEFHKMKSSLAFAVGKDIAGKTMVTDIAKMPHLLVAGATGSGKSVCINTLIMSLIYKSSPEDVKLIMVDPKMVELSVYNGIPHLLIPVVTDPKKAAGALNWAVAEMMKRYKLFSEYNVRDLKGFNTLSSRMGDEAPQKMPQIVIIVDELADLMMVAPQEVEGAICRLAQLARAAGIHLIIATQRPSVNVITGLIKANMPSRIAFAVSSGVDSRTIIDMNGAEKLLGRGDMLFSPANLPKPVRVQGSFVSDKEVFDVVAYLKEAHGEMNYSNELEQEMVSHAQQSAAGSPAFDQGQEDDKDVYFEDAGWAIIDKERASIGMLQRLFKIGFNRAARIMDQLTEAGVVGPEEGTKPRKLLMTKEEFAQFLQKDKEEQPDE